MPPARAPIPVPITGTALPIIAPDAAPPMAPVAKLCRPEGLFAFAAAAAACC